MIVMKISISKMRMIWIQKKIEKWWWRLKTRFEVNPRLITLIIQQLLKIPMIKMTVKCQIKNLQVQIRLRNILLQVKLHGIRVKLISQKSVNNITTWKMTEFGFFTQSNEFMDLQNHIFKIGESVNKLDQTDSSK